MGCVASTPAADSRPARPSGGATAASSREASDKLPPSCKTCSKAASTKWGDMQQNQRKYWVWDAEARSFLCRGCHKEEEQKKKERHEARDKLRLTKMMKYGAKVSKATDLRTLESGREWSESPSFESPLSLSESVEVKMLVWEMTRASDARAKAQEAASSPAAAASVELGASPPPLQLVTPPPDDDAPLPVFAKSAEQRARLGASTQRVLIFRQLSPAQYEAVLDAMFERRVSAGETVIRQGDEADNFYVVESGEFDVFVAKPGQAPRMVMSYVSGGTFGELALLSGAKRAATVVAGPREGALWALGRTAFTRVLVDATRRQRAQYEKFLAPLPFLAGLDAYDRGAMADCLADVVYADGEAVISEGEKGDAFFIVLEGSAAALMRDDSEAGVKETMVYSAGMYFGEMALLRNEPRKATVVARGRLKCARMVVEDFRRILARPLSRMLEERRAGRGAGNERFVR